MSRGLGLAALSVLALACPMPNPAWFESSSASGSASSEGSSSETVGSTSTSSSTTTNNTTASTEPTTSTTTMSTTTTAGTTTDATTTTTSSTSAATTDATTADPSTGSLMCIDQTFIEDGFLNLVAEVTPDVAEFPSQEPCGNFEWSGGPEIVQGMPGRYTYKVTAGPPCGGGMGTVGVTGSYPVLPNNNGGDCVKMKILLDWDSEAQACTPRAFEIFSVNMNLELRFAVGSGVLGLESGNGVAAGLAMGCEAGEPCLPEPGVYKLTSTPTQIAAAEQTGVTMGKWAFYNQRSHIHDEPDPDAINVCLGHFDWILNYVGG